MLDYTECAIETISVHRVGNKTNDEELILAKSVLDNTDTQLRELLHAFFLRPFSSNEFYSFTFSNGDFKLNPLFVFASEIFSKRKTFHSNTVNMAKHLYEVSVHPQIKAGDLFVAYFSDIVMDGYKTDAIGIFKSENKQSFLQVKEEGRSFSMNYEDGISIDKLDKGCLIFNSDADEGYKICIVDKAGKSVEAQYWKDDFLMLKPCSDEYHHTKNFLSITKNYVTTQLAEEFEVTKTDQIDILNRSMEYFQTRENFNKMEFEHEVLQDKGIINSFRKFDETYRKENEIELDDRFEISAPALKKQAKVFKSVLKLDKNFHVYIHGNRELIEHGVDHDGRKFYKLFYTTES